ncbi:MAG TPA: aromatic ring-hydroxylating dioxygenase subunit alpha [Planctomycetota bacterium]|nr:aromatic ring-hydroxylating dioxygenase subunit alpha [Planctomycetota bacterium]
MDPALPTSDYVDPARHALENEHVLRRTWIPVARESDLARAGDYRTFELAGDSIAVVRDEKGTARALHNVCLHRAAVLLRAEAGRIEGRIRCPYHGFTYGLDGALVSVPAPESFQGLEGRRLAPARCESWGGWIWVALDGEGPLAEFLGSLPAELACWELERVERKDRRVSVEPFNWKVGVEAFLESLHVPSIHSGTVHPVADFRRAALDDLGEHSRMSIPFRAPNAYLDDGPFGAAALASGVRPFPRLGRAQLSANLSYLVFPATVLSFLPNHFALFQCVPLAPESTRFTFELYAAPASSDVSARYYDSMKPGYERLVAEDLENLAWIQRGARDRSSGPLALSAHERRIVSFRRALDRRIDAARRG